MTTYESADSIDGGSPEEEALWPLDFLHSQTPAGMPPHFLTVGPGVVVMLLRNLDIEAGLCNGVRAVVVKAMPSVLDVLIVSGAKRGARIYIPRIALAPKTPDLPFTLRRRQFPPKLAWAMTINKAQGQTLNQVGVYLRRPVFSHGQLYVAFSRVGASSRIKVLVENEDAQGRYQDHPDVPDGVYTDNVVWPEALLASTVQQERTPAMRQTTLTAAWGATALPSSSDSEYDYDALSGLKVSECGAVA